MHLTLSPQFALPGQPEMTIHVSGDVITIDGDAADCSDIPEGGEGWTDFDTPFIGPIRRIDGVIHATLVARLGDTAASDQPNSPWVIPDADGSVAIPAARKPDEVDE
jgi:hypothetical protein